MVATETDVTATATVSKRRGKKQDDLTTMEEHQRRIPEIEDMADELIDIDDRLSALKEKHKDAMENLVVSMKKHDRTFYERQTWGRVILKEAATKARVTKAALKGPEDSDSEGDNAEG
jgi:hypothetical protein